MNKILLSIWKILNIKKNAKNKLKKFGFSAVELTVSLIVVACLIAALTPLITKKLQSSNVYASTGTNNDGRLFIYDESDPDCKKTSDGTSVECDFKAPNDVNLVSFVMVGAGGGGAGANQYSVSDIQSIESTENSEKSISITSDLTEVVVTNIIGGGGGGGSASSYKKQIATQALGTNGMTIDQGIENITVELIGSGGKGGKGYYQSKIDDVAGQDAVKCETYPENTYRYAKNQSDCDSIFKNTKYYDKKCYTKYSVGHPKGPTYNASAISKQTIGKICTNKYRRCIWYKTNTSSNYYKHPVGTREAGTYACSNFKPNNSKNWRLWNKSDQTAINAINAKENVLNLFGYQTGHSIEGCDHKNDNLMSTGWCTCWMYNGWDIDPSDDKKSLFRFPITTANKIGTVSSYTPKFLSGHYAWGSRCVLEQGILEHKKGDKVIPNCVDKEAIAAKPGRPELKYGGGGGSGGAKLYVTLPQSVINANIGNQLYVEPPSNCASSGANCKATFAIKKPDGTITYSLEAYGGTAGGNASVNGVGSGGSAQTTCRQKTSATASWTNISCTANGYKGNNGNSSSGAGGTGGNGGDNSTTGKGGNGGSGAGSAGAGLNGSAGSATFRYDKYVQAPISGGGGGAGAYKTSISIDSSILQNNIGGTIVIRAGKGGNAGNNGEESTTLIKNSSGSIVWGYKVSGGSTGGNATSEAVGTAGTGGITCQIYQNSKWENQTCNSGSDGNTGNKSQDGNAISGGSGGGSGYGQGGGGASAKNTTASKGQTGYVKLSYKKMFKSAAGGGGGGASYARVKNIKVTPQKTYKIKVGRGGLGGSPSANGGNGGLTQIVFDSKTYTINGGAGGKIGSPSTLTNSNATPGVGGAGGSATFTTSGLEFSQGQAGNTATSQGSQAIGGNGGKSGINKRGACGGLFVNTSICTQRLINAEELPFRLPRNLQKGNQFGQAGTGGGGGGGGWDLNNPSQSGSGSDGLDGYVYIYWTTFR